MIRVFILEDNKDNLKALAAMVKKVAEDIQILGADSLSNADLVLEKNHEHINVFLLDINLDEKDENNIDGIEFARKIRKDNKYAFTLIVMVTSIANLELQAYRELHCYQYLIKPYREEDIVKLIKDVLFQAGESVESSITVKKDGINYKIPCKNIISVEAITRGVNLTLVSQNFQGYDEMKVLYITIKQLMEKLPADMFIQVHRNSVVNQNFIEYVDIVNRVIRLTNKKEIEIGVTYRNEIKERIGK